MSRTFFFFGYRLSSDELGMGLTTTEEISFVPLLYHTLRGLSRGFLHFFSWLFPVCVVVLRFLLTAKGTFPRLGTRSFLLTSLLYHNLGDLSRGFLHFLRTFFSRAPTPVLHSQWQAFVYGYPLPLTLQIIAHLSIEYNRQNVQNRDFYFLDICAIFRLTNCWSYGIMEFPAETLGSGRLKKPPPFS